MKREQSLKECVVLWDILAGLAHNQLGLDKSEVSGPWENYRHNCPCCESVLSSKDLAELNMDVLEVGNLCQECPMFKQWIYYRNFYDNHSWWTDGNRKKDLRYPCLYSGSPFTQWSNAIELDHPGMLWYDLEFFCLLISELAKEALNKEKLL